MEESPGKKKDGVGFRKGERGDETEAEEDCQLSRRQKYEEEEEEEEEVQLL